MCPETICWESLNARGSGFDSLREHHRCVLIRLRPTDLRKVRYSYFGTFVTLPVLADLTIASGCWLFSEI